MAETQSLPSIQQLHPHPLSQHALSPMHHRDHTSSFRPPQPQPLQHLPPSANPAEAETQPQHPQQPSILPVIYPAANPASTQHYPPNGLPPIDGLSNGHHRILYPILPQAGKDMRPPKREIKRRTKTGCMTCRKRRIKCDEGHPACRNCQKSKRECLGYDPIFKPQGPNAAQMREDASIVTVPQATPEPRPSLTEGQTTVYPTLQNHPYPPPIPAYNGQQARHVDATAPAPQPLSAIHDYIRSPSSQSPNMDHTSTSIKSDPDSTPPVASSLATQASAASATEMRQTRKDLRIRIDDLFLSKDAKTDALPMFERLAKPPTEEELEEIKGSYLTQYAPALNAFFETSWYTVHGGRFLLYRESDIPFYQHCATMFKARMPDPTLETRLIWLYVCLPRLSWEMHKTATPELADLLHRVDVVENLLTGSILPVNLIPPAPPTPRNPPPNAVPTPEFISHSFWHHLGYFSAQDDTSPDFNPGSSACLNMTSSMVAMRQLLLVLENRDVLFSVAIARHFGGRLKHFDEKTLPIGRTQDSEEAQNKFAVAWGFLTREEVDGTTPVVRGIAGMGRRGVLLHHGGGKETRPTTAESV